MGTMRLIRRIVTGAETEDGAGVRLVRVLGKGEVNEFDPFLMLDAFDSRNPDDYIRGFPWHPHRGIETVTYLIEGEIEHGDSLGNRGTIRAGGCQWMTAGSGIIHQEMPQPFPRMLGLQLWLNLPRRDKLTRPRYRDLGADRIPKLHEKGGTVAVISGPYGATAGATRGDYVPALLLDVDLQPGAAWSLEVESQATLFIYIVAGAGFFAADPKSKAESHRAVLFESGDTFAAQAGIEGMRFILFSGRPLREPIAWGGPIVMNTKEELDQAFTELDRNTFLREKQIGDS
jgi:quercetin 2,3-dioxygenase